MILFLQLKHIKIVSIKDELCDNINNMPIDDKKANNINIKAWINDYSPYL